MTDQSTTKAGIMHTEKLTPANSSIVMIDYAVGFANLFRSHSVEANVNAATALAKTAVAFDTPLVVTHGQDTDPPGPIYPSIASVLGEHPIIRREGQFDAFDSPEFADAVARTERETLVMAGLMTEGCLLQTALGGVRRGYEVVVVADACAGESTEAHAIALQRLQMAGVVPTTWLSLATEYVGSWDNYEYVPRYVDNMMAHSPQLGMNLIAHAPTAA